ncbi:MAG: sec-independent protein translocase protein TatC [Frankiaceae bacterium]|jgi:sec-independent protein translocase protein TatC|nr:sec-independent protein translocase protein TatC [Frankiaceae bacterium]MDX6273107.1 sec-independent protein translocase protein TatC [Frankiales bacterium]
MPLMEHVRELRNRVLKAVLGLAVGTAAAWFLFDSVWALMTRQFCALPQSRELTGHCDLLISGVFDAFFLKLKVSFLLGLVFGSPIWLYQLWAFVAPGLHRREKRWALGFVAAAVPLFCFGAYLAYVTLPVGLRILLGFTPEHVVNALRVTDYLRYLTTMLLVFGVSFEFPLLLLLLNLAGVLTYARLAGWWRGMILGIFVFAAVATPSQDPFTMLALAAPMCVFYVVVLLIAWIRRRRGGDGLYSDLPDDEPSTLEV